MKHSKVGSMMTGEVVTVTRDTPFKEVTRLLSAHRISGVPVVDDGKVVGVLSESDLLVRQAEAPDPYAPPRRLRHPLLGWRARTLRAKAHARTAGQLMSTPPVTARAGDTIAEAARTMAQHKVERLPVVDEEGRPVGIVTRRDLLQIFLRSDEDIRREVIDEVLVRTLWLTPRSVSVQVEDGVVTLRGTLERSSEISIAVHLTRQVDGVVGVVQELNYQFDDSRPQPAGYTVHGVTEDWLHKL